MDQSCIFEWNPLADRARWDEFIERHPRGGIFHTSGWLQALQDTYRYRPLWVTTNPPEAPLGEGFLFCEVSSWLTGRRLVSLPFSDHCDPLVTLTAAQDAILEHLRKQMADRYRYIEFRPSPDGNGAVNRHDAPQSESFLFHTLPLDRPIGELFQGLHKDCIQRKVRRAKREGLDYEGGGGEPLLEQFYQLLLRTRRRHGLPPQPLQWFRNLSRCLGDRLSVHVASKAGEAVAAIVTLHCKDTVTYKYGCSDERFSNLGGTPFLFWKIIEQAHDCGAMRIDLGRTDLDNEGLAMFKERLGGVRQRLNYYRISEPNAHRRTHKPRITQWLRPAVSCIPDSLLAVSGRFLYRHIG